MSNRKQLRIYGFVTTSALLVLFGGCAGYLRLGTTVVTDVVSPDEKWDALITVRNGGAMTGYATAISMVSAHNPIARQAALFGASHVLFVLDDNDGAVQVGELGQLNVGAKWTSAASLIVTYPHKARILRQNSSFRSLSIHYVPSE
jgi:hypothetical protein